MSTNNKSTKSSFWQSGFCSLIIVIFAVFFVFGLTCTIWRVVTSSQSVVSNGNVFGYSVESVYSNDYSQEYKAGDLVVVRHMELGNTAPKALVVYNVDNEPEMLYNVCKVVDIDAEHYEIHYTDDNGNAKMNIAKVVGCVVETDALTMGIIQVINSSIMFWLFVVIFGLAFLALIIGRRRALSH